MNSPIQRIRLALKAVRQLGFQQAGLYAAYQLELRSGYLRWRTPVRQSPAGSSKQPLAAAAPLFSIPDHAALTAVMSDRGVQDLLNEADEIVSGQARLFGGPPVALRLNIPGPLKHWSAYAKGQGLETIQDIKLIWEPGRFGWAFTLGRAYCVTGDERYPAAFWSYVEDFLDANPANLGPHWASAQEVALRLIAFVFALQVFAASPQTSIGRTNRLSQAIAEHAARIPSTLAYSRAQNNNHLLTEAAGLYTAGVLLPSHPSAGRWRELGWHWLNIGLQNQIAPDGAYVQHSTNYQRLMLQTALWVWVVAARRGQALPDETLSKLSLATRWLLALLDRESGQTPNLGPNDGAYILPLCGCPFSDYRPALQAASAVFLAERPFEPGPWDEMPLWLLAENPSAKSGDFALQIQPSNLYSPPSLPYRSWAYLRVAQGVKFTPFTSRPGHADQLHLDLWWRGLNVAQDAGTYSYNSPPPWDNALAQTAVHNTVTVDGYDQMLRAGRFLFLDWAEAKITAHEQAEDSVPWARVAYVLRTSQSRNYSADHSSWERLTAQHDGYRRLGLIHQRAVTVTDKAVWVVEDTLLPIDPTPSTPYPPRSLRLHWLLPDWPWEVKQQDRDLRFEIMVQSPHGWVNLSIYSRSAANPERRPLPSSPISDLQLVRAGELLFGSRPAAPIQGWASPTYGVRVPALSVAAEVKGALPLGIASQFTFPS
jgi:hypothetical protein